MKNNLFFLLVILTSYCVYCQTCNFIAWDDPAVCNYRNGTCSQTEINNCTCRDPRMEGDYCTDWTCNGRHYTDPDVCTNHGICRGPEDCDCLSSNYTGDYCESWECFGVERQLVISVCSGHGDCDDVDECFCRSELYNGSNCDLWFCWDESVYEVDTVCSSHGFCFDNDFCRCGVGYSGDECDTWDCGGLINTDGNACNQHGSCIGNQICSCRDGYEGRLCHEWSCQYDCSGHGECLSPMECDCSAGFAGDGCSRNTLYGSVMTPILLLFFFFSSIFLCVFCCVFTLVTTVTCVVCIGLLGLTVVIVVKQYLGMSKFRKLKNFDILLKEQELEEEEGIAHLSINRGLFEVDYEEIEVKEIIGEGGSNSRVFKAIWKGRTVAFKCFKTRFVCHNQEKYDEFEREVQILASLSHPNVVRFFGASLKPPRVGILMEFCVNGELYNYLTKYTTDNKGESVPILRKIRMALEIASSLNYLHSRSIIHRDLKCENVLVDDNECCKLMDFGLSRTVDRLSVKKTVRIGTNNYMAPEVVTTGLYTTKCDVFSYGVMLWVMFTENDTPYGEVSFQLEFQVANKPNFRPSLDQLRDKLGSKFLWLESVITICWSHEPEHRFTFGEIVKFINKKLTDQEQFTKKSAATNAGPVRIGRTKNEAVDSKHLERVYDFKFYEDEIQKEQEKFKEGVVDLGLRKKLESLKTNQKKLYDCLDMIRKNNLDLRDKYNNAKKEYQQLRKKGRE